MLLSRAVKTFAVAPESFPTVPQVIRGVRTCACSPMGSVHVSPVSYVADRDHCLQYVVAVALLYGTLTAEHYEEAIAQDPRIDELRRRIHVVENPQYSADYLDPDRRSARGR